MVKSILILLMVVGGLKSLDAQFKYEKESVISEQEVPDSAKEFIKGINNFEKLVWYKEESLDSYSYEAKLKLGGKSYSIEFDSTGLLEDVEMLLKWKSLAQDTKSKISEYLNSSFQSWRVKRLQFQVVGSLEDCINYLNGNGVEDSLRYNFELITRIKSHKKHKVKELLFDKSGKFIESRTLVLDPIDNLEF